MSFTKISDANIGASISALGDNPNTDDNLTATQLKAKFDYDGYHLKDYINNTLVEELDDFAEDVDDALDDKLDVGSLPSAVGIKIGTEIPTYGTGDDQITDGQIYLKYSTGE